MPRGKPQRFEFDSLLLETRSVKPLYQQLEDQLREAIRSGYLRPGEKLPSTRGLSRTYTISRNTVAAAFAQLIAEGYLEAEVGSGTRVSRELPEKLLQGPVQEPRSRNTCPGLPLSRRGRDIAECGTWTPAIVGSARPFRPHLPALDMFPHRLWQKLTEQRLRHLSRDLCGHVDPRGYCPLRKAVAEYLGVARGVRCSPDQVMIVAGAQQALDFISRLLMDPGDALWMEEPGYTSTRHVFALAGCPVVTVPVDEEGLDMAAVPDGEPAGRLVYVTPSSQWPLGMTMSLPRRLALLEWARRHRAWILEDDYNGEFRYAGRPLPALYGLDEAGCVIYMGTFSKVLFPSLRLGYLVLPERLVDGFAAARWLADRYSPPLEQAVLTEFLQEGHFARHVRKMRTLYAARQEALVDSLHAELGDAVQFKRRDAGMQLVVKATDRRREARLMTSAADTGMEFHPVSAYSAYPQQAAGMILGFAAYAEEEIRSAVRAWAQAFSR